MSVISLDALKAGVFQMDESQYHADPIPGGSLSSSGARRLLPPGCPAKFRHEQLHGRKVTKPFEFGTAAHRLVLGVGPELVRIDHDSWRTAAAKDAAAEARERGAVPLLYADYTAVHAMAAALRAHPIARALFAPETGQPEQTLLWMDERTGAWLRARIDWLPNVSDRRTIVADYKTCITADPGKLEKVIYDHGYFQQDAWYREGVKAVHRGGADTSFVFVFQEKTAPYLVTVVELDALAVQIGAARNREAIDIWLRCRETGHWPGYSSEVESICLPRWVEQQYMEASA